MERIISSLRSLVLDEYKGGVEARARMPVVYLNPNALDSWSAERVLKLNEGDILTRKDLMAKKILAEQISAQLDEQSPGLSSRLSESEIEKLYMSSLSRGPFVSNDTMKGLSIVNMPKGNQFDKEKILETFRLTTSEKQEPAKEDPNDTYRTYYADERPVNAFDIKHIKPLPGANSMWEELIGQHEGEHTNQGSFDVQNDKFPNLTILDKEVKADRAALADMRAKGQTEVAQSFAHLRALAAAEGDNVHATSIFLDQDNYKGVTKEHMYAATFFKREMVEGVAAEINISKQASEALRKSDPQKFVRVLDEALKNNRIPNPEEIGHFSKTEKIAAEMGLTTKEFERLGSDRLPDIMAAHDKLKKAGAFQQPGKENPYVREYIEKYSSAVKSMFIEDTTPVASTKRETPAPKKSTEQIIASLSAQDMEEEAKSHSPQNNMYEVVATRLGIKQDEAIDLSNGNAEEKARFLEAAETLLREGKIKAEFHRTQTETIGLLQKAMGVSEGEFKSLQARDPYKIYHAYDRLSKEGALTVPYDNPYVIADIAREIKNERDNLAEMKKKLEELKNKSSYEESIEEEQETAPEADAVPEQETVSMTKPAPKVAINGTPQIDLHGEEGPRMKIGGVSPGTYFAQQANPEQPIAAAAPAQPEQQPAVTTKQSPALRF